LRAGARQPAGFAMMDKTFDPAAVEARIASRWEAAEAFKAGREIARMLLPIRSSFRRRT